MSLQPVRESNLCFRKWQIKTALTNIVGEHAKSHSNARKGHSKSEPEYACQLKILMCNVMVEILLILYTSRYHIYKIILAAK